VPAADPRGVLVDGLRRSSERRVAHGRPINADDDPHTDGYLDGYFLS
jgi:hypothetical protein